MAWLLFACLTACFESFKDVTMKHSLRDAPASLVAWSWVFFSLPFLALALLQQPPVVLGGAFWLALATSGSLNILAISLYAHALKHSDLSVTLPMIAFSPLFLLVSGPIIVGEFPSAGGVVGVLLVVAGSYLLNIRERRQGYLAPYKALLRERGPQFMLGVALIWGVAATIDKVGVQNSSPVFWIASSNTVVSLGLTPLLLRSGANIRHLRVAWPYLLIIGFFAGLALMFQMMAIELTLVAYVISVKRLSIMLGVLSGFLLFREQNIRARLAGVSVMLLGVVCITLL